MADFPLFQLIPSGTVGIGAVPNTNPWELRTQRDTLTPAQYNNLADLLSAVNGAGTITNFADAAAEIVCFRIFVPLAAGVNARALIQFGGTGLGLGGICKIPPVAGIMSGAVGAAIASLCPPMYMETTVRLNAVIGAAPEIVFIFAPSFTVASGTLGSANGFGLAYFNTAANDNYRIFVADASGALLVNVDTGVNALAAAIQHIRLEWGWIAGAPRIRAIIDGGAPVDAVGPFALNTANRLGAFASTLSVGVDKMQASVANEIEALVGHVQGIVLGMII